jgi:hypothetical protein
MDAFKKLELSTESLRDLTSDELTAVAGGAAAPSGLPCEFYVTYLCPSGETWTANCNGTGTTFCG